MTELKNSLDWLKAVESTPLQSTLKFLDMAYQNFFRRLKKGKKQSYTSKCVGKNIQILEDAAKNILAKGLRMLA